MLLYVALAVQTYWYIDGTTFYGAYLHWTGQWSAHLLLATLLVTPLRLLLGQKAWIRWLLRRRRDIGVACFVYALAHTIAYLLQQDSLQRIVDESLDVAILTGWVAFIVFALLTLTSNNYSVRRFGRKWKALHNWVFVGALLTFLHWILTAFDPLIGYVHMGILIALLLVRVAVAKRQSDWRKTGNSDSM